MIWMLLGIGYAVGLVIGILGFASDAFGEMGDTEFKRSAARYLILMPVWPLVLVYHGFKGVGKAWALAELPAPRKKVRWKN